MPKIPRAITKSGITLDAYMPLHHFQTDEHWMLALIEMRPSQDPVQAGDAQFRLTVQHFDSMYDAARARKVEKVLSAWLNVRLPWKSIASFKSMVRFKPAYEDICWGLPADNSVAVCQSGPQQQDTISCGVAVLATLEALLATNEPPSTFNETKSRQRLLELAARHQSSQNEDEPPESRGGGSVIQPRSSERGEQSADIVAPQIHC